MHPEPTAPGGSFPQHRTGAPCFLRYTTFPPNDGRKRAPPPERRRKTSSRTLRAEPQGRRVFDGLGRRSKLCDAMLEKARLTKQAGLEAMLESTYLRETPPLRASAPYLPGQAYLSGLASAHRRDVLRQLAAFGPPRLPGWMVSRFVRQPAGARHVAKVVEARRQARADAKVKAAFAKPYLEEELPPELRARPLSDTLPASLVAQPFAGPGFQGVALPGLSLSVVSADRSAKAGRLVKKAAALLQLLSLPLVGPAAVTVTLSKGGDDAFFDEELGEVVISERHAFAVERSDGMLLHELVHALEPHLAPSFQAAVDRLYRKEKRKIDAYPAAVVDKGDGAASTPRAATFNYASLHKREFLACAVEAWFNASPLEVLRPGPRVASLRLARNRLDLWRLFPDTAAFLARFLKPYDYDNVEIDAFVRRWPTTASLDGQTADVAALEALGAVPSRA